MLITIEQILSRSPCDSYNTAEKIIALTDDDWPKTPLEVAALSIPAEDKLWALLHESIIPERDLHLLACDFAEHVLPIYEDSYPDDQRPRIAIETKRRWIAGEATDKELWLDSYAAWDAATAAYYDEASDAVWNASSYHTPSAAWSAAQSAIRTRSYGEDNWQLQRVIEVLEKLKAKSIEK